MSRRTIILVLILLLACVPYIKAGERLWLEPVSASVNLPHTDVNAVVGDNEGFIWFGTYAGLCRWDGIAMTVYNVNNSLLESSRIRSLHLADNGLLYVGTETGGVAIFDTVNDRFISTLPVPLSNVYSIFEYGNKICLCSDAGITFLEYSGEVSTVDSHWLDTKVMGGCSVPGKGIVLCTPGGLLLCDDRGGNVHLRKVLDGIYCISAILLEDKNRILVAGYDGCFVVNPEDWSFRKINSYEATALYESPDGNLWVGTSKWGMLCYDRNFNILHRWGPYHEYGFDSCNITSFYMDSSSVLWIGTIGNGCYKKNSHTENFRLWSLSEGAGKDHIVCLYADSHGRLWISARDGSLWAMTGDNLKRVSSSSLGDFKDSPISYIKEDSDGDLLVGAWTKGIRVIPVEDLPKAAEGSPFRTRRLASHPVMDQASVYMSTTDPSGNMWFSTNCGVFRYARNSSWTNFSSDPSNINSIADNFCTDILAEEYKGRTYLWVGTKLGLSRFILDEEGNVKSVTRINPSQNSAGLSGEFVSVIHRDREDSLWVATLGGGLNKLVSSRDSEELLFRHYDKDSYGFAGNELESLQEDVNGAFWIGSSSGLSKFDPATGALITFSMKDGLQSDVFKIWASTQFRDGRMAFGGPGGFNIFNPEEIESNAMSPKIVLTGLEINGTPVSPGDTIRRKPLTDKPLRHTEKIVLPHDCNSLTFRFAALHYVHPEKNRYMYHLEGWDNIRHYTDGKNPVATYLNLKPGKYTFSVTGANSDGVWSTAPAVIQVTVRPPLWQSRTAWIVYCIAFVVLIIYIKNAWQKRNRQHYELEMEHKLRLEEEQRNEDELKFHTDFLHEIKTPLTLISSPVDELLDNPNLGKTTRDRLMLVRHSAMILQRHIDTVTDLRKYDNGNIRLKVVKVDFCRFVEEIVLLFVPYMKSKGIAFCFDKAEKPIDVYEDKEQMEKVIMNLMSNAIRYSFESGGEIKVTIRKDSSGGYDGVRLSVSNKGMGILPEDITKVFDRFHQGVNNSGRKGMGIGLAISKHIVTMHKGRIWAESVPGETTVFHVLLRTGDAHFDEAVIDRGYSNSDNISNYDDLPVELPPTLSKPAPGDEKLHTVLIADDSPDLRAYLQKLLSPLYNVLVASDGQQAYDRAIADQPDLIVSDVIMPKMNGMEFCARIKNNPDTSHIPFMLLSARNLPVDKVEGFESLADEYMTKPFYSEVLISRIENLIKQRESMREAFRKDISLSPAAVSGTTSDERFMKTVISAIEEHMAEPEFGVEELCAEIGVSRPSLYRKIKSLTGLSAIRFLRSIRLKRAAQLLASDSSLPVSSVMYATGFSNISYFSKIFFEEFHTLPKDYGRRD